MYNSHENSRINSVLIVGGGDTGLLSALLLREFNPEVSIKVVDDFTEAIPEIGKSTFDYIRNILHNVLNIDERRFISRVKPVWKSSVYFNNWCGHGPFHVPFDDFSIPPSKPGKQRFEELYYRYNNCSYRTVGSELVEHKRTPFNRNNQFYKSVAYHLSNNRFNEFLRTICSERDIELVNDCIDTVNVTDGEIVNIESDKYQYAADLYIDATGFERSLMKNIPNEFTSFDLPLDSALVTKIDISFKDIIPATVINTGTCGWFWQIDTYDWRDLGYVYSSKHLSDKEARSEFVANHDDLSEAASIRKYEFDAGRYNEAWVNNCIAVGNALGFVEPLQSTALTLNASLSEKLSKLLADHDNINHPGVQNIYNDLSREIWENVYDFISAHYAYSTGNTQFWREVRSVNNSRIRERVRLYNKNGFNSFQEFSSDYDSGLKIFNQWSFYRLLRSLGVKSIFYENQNPKISQNIINRIDKENKKIKDRARDHLTYTEVYRDNRLSLDI